MTGFLNHSERFCKPRSKRLKIVVQWSHGCIAYLAKAKADNDKIYGQHGDGGGRKREEERGISVRKTFVSTIIP